MNPGKKFEAVFKKSLENEGIFCLRLKDAGGWGFESNQQKRFTISNPCDYIVHAGGILYLCELKHIESQSSLPFSRIKQNQLKELIKYSTYIDVCPVLIVDFHTYNIISMLHISQVNKYINNADRKSIPLDYFKDCGDCVTRRDISNLFYCETF